ncbi:MAG: hypothetical protein QOF84_4517 [Streptomyces sp.]|nr:hypothetical protein [Streptomyces sp.]
MSRTGILSLFALWLVAVPGVIPLMMRERHRSIRAALTLTTGVVTGYKVLSYVAEDGVFESYRPTVRFVTESGQLVHATSTVWPWDHQPDVGQEVSVLYEHDHPEEWFFVGNWADYDIRTRNKRTEVVVTGLLLPAIPLGLMLLTR